jgi:hypothetical protein
MQGITLEDQYNWTGVHGTHFLTVFVFIEKGVPIAKGIHMSVTSQFLLICGSSHVVTKCRECIGSDILIPFLENFCLAVGRRHYLTVFPQFQNGVRGRTQT